MNDISADYIYRAELWLFITILFYFLMNGAQIFETAVIVPKWATSVPESFIVFKGDYALDFKTFWIVMHSIHEITFILAIVFCWKLEIRNDLLILFTVHFAVRVWTLVYFAPNIMAFQKIANGEIQDTNLAKKVKLWKKLNYLRVALFIAVSIALIPLYLKLLHP